jgi:uracil-DNA glycosylase
MDKATNVANEHFVSVAQTVADWQQYLPAFLPLPHPSPRNNIWLRKNPWFEDDVLPVLRRQVAMTLGLPMLASD